MNLLIVTTVPSTIESFLLPYAEHFRSRGWRVDALAADATSSEACVQGFDNVFDASWSRNPLSLRGLREIVRVRRLLAEQGYDIVHVHTPVAAFLTRMAAAPLRRRGLRVVYTAHGFHFSQAEPWYRNAIYLTLERLAGRWTDRLVVINGEDYEAARRYGIVPDAWLVHMHGIGVDTAHYDKERIPGPAVDKIREELGLCGDDVLFLVVAEFNANKRQRQVVDAFAALGTASAVLAFAGEGRLRDSIESHARATGARGRIRFLGQRGDVPVLLAASAATVLASRREGLPRASMESLSMCVPVIGADIRGIRDLLDDGCGLLVPSGDRDALTRAMGWVIEHPEEASDMGARGRLKMLGAYTISAVLSAHDTLYADLQEP
ncbi:MAG: glycosyltransferase family 4 protein [Coriobacteriia bacterium]